MIELAVFATGGSRLVTVGCRPRVIAFFRLPAEAAVGAAAEADTRADLGLTSGRDGLASLFNPFVVGETGACRAVAGFLAFKEVRLGSLGSVGDFLGGSAELPFFAESITAIGLAVEPRVKGFSILGDAGARGVRGEVGDVAGDFAGGIRLVGGGLTGFASLVVLSFTRGGG
jgi:hypothetical protein